ncbi:hypothetical protein [Streptomyces tendae]|uniref:hypothetical protein n=1 Tax=Streptomyces tendae TaxID=1932 RepID=UPI0036C67478
MTALNDYELVHPSLAAFAGMAPSRLGTLSPAERRVQAAETVTVPAATPPPGSDQGGLTDDDLVASLFDVISDVAPLEADVAVHLGRPLPNPLIDTLVRAINAPVLRDAGGYVEARGHCGTSTVHITATPAAAGAR